MAQNTAATASLAEPAARPIPEEVQRRVLEFGAPLKKFQPEFVGALQYAGPRFAFRQVLILKKADAVSDIWDIAMHAKTFVDDTKKDTSRYASFRSAQGAKAFFSIAYQYPDLRLSDADDCWGQSLYGYSLSHEDRQQVVAWVEGLTASDRWQSGEPRPKMLPSGLVRSPVLKELTGLGGPPNWLESAEGPPQSLDRSLELFFQIARAMF
jgi:hypothetical protein